MSRLLVDQIQKAVETNPGAVHIILPVKTKKGSPSASDLKGINARIGYFVTRFNPGRCGPDPDRAACHQDH